MKIIFVYNADSHFFSQAADFAHKIMKPETYACNLCLLTYGNVFMNNKWKEYLKTIEQELTFLHKNEFQAGFPKQKGKLPAIFVLSDQENGVGEIVSELVGAEELDAIKSLDDLIELMKKRVAELKGQT